MAKTAIIYSYNTQKSKKVAERIIEAFGTENIESVNAEVVSKAIIEQYENFIISAPTWFDGELPNYWDEFLPDLEEMDLKSKKFAIFGLGDQKGYPENFCDAIGLMAEILEGCNATIVGKVSEISDFTFENSKALRNGKFLGQPLDQENQARLTGKRISAWVTQLKTEFTS